MPTLSVRLLGGFSLALDGEPLFTVNTVRLQSLLAYLLLHRGSPISRQHLAFLFWPDSSEGQAHTNLRKLLHELRALLPYADTLILADTRAVWWDPDASTSLDVDVDMDRFDERASQVESLEDLQQTVELYQGDLLPACYDEWILPERERLRQKYQEALERLVGSLEERGDYRAALVYARRQLQYDPLSEETYRQLMRLAALSGNRAQVVWFYKSCTAILQRELGMEPSAETRAVYSRCLDLAAQSPIARAVAVTPPGGKRLNNLPFDLTRLVGREREREEIMHLALATNGRLLTLTGPPGVGKTRLAIQASTDMLDHFRGGACFVDLAPLRDPGLVVPTIARVFGLSEGGGLPLAELLKQYLRGREVLLVLDNFEHITQSAGDVLELLGSCSQLRVLATSRVPLRLRGEHEYPVHPLPLPARSRSGDLPGRDQLAQNESVRLFVERAQNVIPSFELTDDNAHAVAQICIRLDGLPLAIEMAAARTRLFSPQALLGRLEHSLQLLTGDSRDLPDRHSHRTLRNEIEWSYGLLTEGEQQLFRRMSVFNGGRSLEALEAVCNFDGKLQVGVLEGAERLIEQSLVEQREGRDGEPRLWMLETIHEFAREKLWESEEGETLNKEHARYFFALCEEAESGLSGPDQPQWLDRLDDEHDNLRSALRWSKESDKPEDIEAGLSAVAAIFWFWVPRGYYTEGREHLKDLLARAACLPPPGCSKESRAKALNAASNLARQQGDLSAAQPPAEDALRLAREAGDKAGLAGALNNLGVIASRQWNTGAARSLLEESLAIRRELGDKDAIAASIYNLGFVAVMEGDYRRAHTLYDECLAINKEMGDKEGIVWNLYNIAGLAADEGNYDQAHKLVEECLVINREMDDRDAICGGDIFLGHLALWGGDYARAGALYEESLAMGREMASKSYVMRTLLGMAALASLQEDHTAASTLYDEVAGLEREQGDEILSVYFSGIAANERGDYATARPLIEKTLTLFVERGFRRGIIETLGELARVLVGLGETRRGAVLLGGAEALGSDLGAVLCRYCTIPFVLAYEGTRAAAQIQLGQDEFQEAWQEGQAMTREEAIHYALEGAPAYT